MANRFSNTEKAQELRRELGMRRHVYPRRVAEGKLKQDVCDRQIAMVEEMLRDYEALAAIDTPDLFSCTETVRDDPAAFDPHGGNVARAPRETVTRTIARPIYDPTFGKTPGVEIEREGQRFGTCKCGESTLTGQVRDAMTSTLNYRVFDAMPLEHNGFRYYTRHQCEYTRRRS